MDSFGSFHDGLGNCRMRMHRAAQLFSRRLQLHGYTSFSNQFGRVWSNDMHAQDLVILLFGDDLYKAFFLAENARLAGGRKRKLANLDVVALLLRFRFSQTN